MGCGLGTAKALRNLDGPGRCGAAIQRSAASTQFTKLRAAVAAGATFKNGSFVHQDQKRIFSASFTRSCVDRVVPVECLRSATLGASNRHFGFDRVPVMCRPPASWRPPPPNLTSDSQDEGDVTAPWWSGLIFAHKPSPRVSGLNGHQRRAPVHNLDFGYKIECPRRRR